MKDHTCHIPLLVILFIGVGMLLFGVGTIWLVANGKDPAVVMVISGLCNASLGLLGGVLVQTGRTPDKDHPASVVVENRAGDPVPVTQEESDA